MALYPIAARRAHTPGAIGPQHPVGRQQLVMGAPPTDQAELAADLEGEIPPVGAGASVGAPPLGLGLARHVRGSG